MISQKTLDACDPGIRALVLALNEAGIETSDSGDGTKADMECALSFPHVAGPLDMAPSRAVYEIAEAADHIAAICSAIQGHAWTCEAHFGAQDRRWTYIAFPEGVE